MAKKNVAKAVEAAATPAADEKKVSKIPRKQLDALLAAQLITAEAHAKAMEEGYATSGEGGGEDIREQLKNAGVPAELVQRLYDTLDELNAALWSDKKYVGQLVPHKTKSGEQFDSQLEAAIWVKHHKPSEK